jgi:DNA-binding NarL/FixJ family response regulator
MADGTYVISVLVVEDDEALRREFVAMIDAAPGIALVEAVGSLSDARDALKRHKAPDVLIIDLGLPDGDGAALISELAVTSPSTSALVVTIFGDEGHVVRALEAGAKGYLLKDAMLEEFARAVRLVHAGGSPLSPSIARHLLKRFAPAAPAQASRPGGKAAPVEMLTPREAEILQLIAAGHSIAETAAALELSAHTVSTHVKHIYGKLAVSSRMQAVNRARATGQID